MCLAALLVLLVNLVPLDDVGYGTENEGQQAEMRVKLALLEKNDEDNLEAINDLSEDVRREIDNLFQAIAELAIKSKEPEKPRNKIGFKI